MKRTQESWHESKNHQAQALVNHHTKYNIHYLYTLLIVIYVGRIVLGFVIIYCFLNDEERQIFMTEPIIKTQDSNSNT